MRKKIFGILLISLSALALLISAACDSSKSKSVGSPENLTIGTYLGDLSALFWIAKDRGYFSEQGVNVQLQTHESGLESYMDLLAGKVDLATITEFVFARNVYKRPDVRVLAVVGQTNNLKLVARKDHGITQMSDIRKKRIGLVRDSVAEYYLHLLLMFHQIALPDCEIVDLPPSEQVKALKRGEIDAVVVWEPFAREMQKQLGTNGVSWSAQGGQDFYWLLIGTDETLRKRSSAIRAVLAGLASADDFIKAQREEARKIVAAQVGSNHMPALWETHGLTLSLSRPFVVAMEGELRWMNSKQGVEEFNMPDFLDFIHFDALNSVRPEKIQMLH